MRVVAFAAGLLIPVFTVNGQDRGATLRDSAGIHLVENITPLWPAGGGRRLEAAPAITLGLGRGNEDEFGNVQGAVRLADGSILVADRRNSNLKLFSATGSFVRKIGQRGEGPGDFSMMWNLYRVPGDTIVTWDLRQHRLTWFTSDGKARRTLAVARPPIVTFPGGQRMGSSVAVFGMLADGSALGYHQDGRMNPPTALYSDTIHLTHANAAGVLAPLASLFQGESYSYNSSDHKYSSGDDRPFTTKASVAAGAATFWYTDGRKYELREYDLSGKVKRIVRLRRTPTAVTDAEVATFKASELEALKREKFKDEASRQPIMDLQREIQRWMSFPKLRPAYSRLIAEPGGALWARQYGDTTKAQHWDSFDRSGRYLGVVDTPAGLEVLEIGADYMLGRFKDADDVESVGLYRFVK